MPVTLHAQSHVQASYCSREMASLDLTKTSIACAFNTLAMAACHCSASHPLGHQMTRHITSGSWRETHILQVVSLKELHHLFDERILPLRHLKRSKRRAIGHVQVSSRVVHHCTGQPAGQPLPQPCPNIGETMCLGRMICRPQLPGVKTYQCECL